MSGSAPAAMAARASNEPTTAARDIESIGTAELVGRSAERRLLAERWQGGTGRLARSGAPDR